jgi:hypothetical protein
LNTAFRHEDVKPVTVRQRKAAAAMARTPRKKVAPRAKTARQVREDQYDRSRNDQHGG